MAVLPARRGQLAALGRVNAYTYSRDNDLDSLISIVPFGMPAEDPQHTRPAIRGVVPGIGADDKLVIWAGGIYDWFDPETLIEAIGEVASRHPDIRLFFMGVKHPNPDVPEMGAVARARMRADELGLTGTSVFFHDGWVPYDERQNYLLEADLGASTHFQHVETTFSFRTRILDYLWAGLPILTTAGDSFADLVERENLGRSVPECDKAALVAALEELLFSDAAVAARENVHRVREDYTWERVLVPLLEFCRSPAVAADKAVLEPRQRRASGRPRQVERRPQRAGFMRDLARVRYYLQNGGPAAVVERLQARIKRFREDR
jgi:glycosyltransferase involved in cell wall biosynthesis